MFATVAFVLALSSTANVDGLSLFGVDRWGILRPFGGFHQQQTTTRTEMWLSERTVAAVTFR